MSVQGRGDVRVSRCGTARPNFQSADISKIWPSRQNELKILIFP